MNVSEMQRALSVKAEKAPEHKFDDLFSLITNQTWLEAAQKKVASNAGSVTAGTDGITMRHYERDLEGNLQALRESLKTGTFKPHPVRRVHIPKSNGKTRPLGIPSIQDRIVQEAIRMVLEPIYEADFVQTSYGFRPNRSTQDAVMLAKWYMAEKKRYFWVVEGDIASYFDSIKHKKLMKLLKRRIKDKKLLDLIWSYLKAGVMERKLFKPTEKGTPQGGIISPLLANIYLHELDVYMQKYTTMTPKQKRQRRRQGKGNFVYIRYADDFIILCNGRKAEAESIKKEVHDFLSNRLRLKLSWEKTKVTHVDDGFEFLGYKLIRKVGGKGTRTIKVEVPDEAFRRIRRKIQFVLSRTTLNDSATTKLKATNALVRGWCNYYRYVSNPSKWFSKLNHLLYWQAAHWMAAKYRTSIPSIMKRYKTGSTITVSGVRLLVPTMDVKRGTYRRKFFKPNPYTTDGKNVIRREEMFDLDYEWTGREAQGREGFNDLRHQALKRDQFTCQSCGTAVTEDTAQVHHRKEVSSYNNPQEAHRLDNVETLCVDCHALLHGWKEQVPC